MDNKRNFIVAHVLATDTLSAKNLKDELANSYLFKEVSTGDQVSDKEVFSWIDATTNNSRHFGYRDKESGKVIKCELIQPNAK